LHELHVSIIFLHWLFWFLIVIIALLHPSQPVLTGQNDIFSPFLFNVWWAFPIDPREAQVA
jgi:hypothetical protein